MGGELSTPAPGAQPGHVTTDTGANGNGEAKPNTGASLPADLEMEEDIRVEPLDKGAPHSHTTATNTADQRARQGYCRRCGFMTTDLDTARQHANSHRAQEEHKSEQPAPVETETPEVTFEEVNTNRSNNAINARLTFDGIFEEDFLAAARRKEFFDRLKKSKEYLAATPRTRTKMTIEAQTQNIENETEDDDAMAATRRDRLREEVKNEVIRRTKHDNPLAQIEEQEDEAKKDEAENLFKSNKAPPWFTEDYKTKAKFVTDKVMLSRGAVVYHLRYPKKRIRRKPPPKPSRDHDNPLSPRSASKPGSGGDLITARAEAGLDTSRGPFTGRLMGGSGGIMGDTTARATSGSDTARSTVAAVATPRLSHMGNVEVEGPLSIDDASMKSQRVRLKRSELVFYDFDDVDVRFANAMEEDYQRKLASRIHANAYNQVMTQKRFPSDKHPIDKIIERRQKGLKKKDLDPPRDAFVLEDSGDSDDFYSELPSSATDDSADEFFNTNIHVVNFKTESKFQVHKDKEKEERKRRSQIKTRKQIEEEKQKRFEENVKKKEQYEADKQRALERLEKLKKKLKVRLDKEGKSSDYPHAVKELALKEARRFKRRQRKKRETERRGRRKKIDAQTNLQDIGTVDGRNNKTKQLVNLDEKHRERERKLREDVDRLYIDNDLELPVPVPPNIMILAGERLNKFEEPIKLKPRPRDPYLELPKPKPYARPGSMELIVMLHSIAGYSYEFWELGSKLVDEGYTVLTFDFYGHGETPYPDAKQMEKYPFEADLDLYVEQTADLLRYLGFIRDDVDDTLPATKHKKACFTFTLIGFDLGGAVATGFSELYSREVEALILMSPYGLPVTKTIGDYFSWLLACFRTEGDIISKSARSFYDADRYEIFLDRVEEEIAYQVQNTSGYLQALRSIQTFFPLQKMERTYYNVGRDPRPVLVIWGKDDDIVPYSNFRKTKKFIKNASMVSIGNVGHQLMYEAYDIVTAAISRFLRQSGIRGIGVELPEGYVDMTSEEYQRLQENKDENLIGKYDLTARSSRDVAQRALKEFGAAAAPVDAAKLIRAEKRRKKKKNASQQSEEEEKKAEQEAIQKLKSKSLRKKQKLDKDKRKRDRLDEEKRRIEEEKEREIWRQEGFLYPIVKPLHIPNAQTIDDGLDEVVDRMERHLREKEEGMLKELEHHGIELSDDDDLPSGDGGGSPRLNRTLSMGSNSGSLEAKSPGRQGSLARNGTFSSTPNDAQGPALNRQMSTSFGRQLSGIGIPDRQGSLSLGPAIAQAVTPRGAAAGVARQNSIVTANAALQRRLSAHLMEKMGGSAVSPRKTFSSEAPNSNPALPGSGNTSPGSSAPASRQNSLPIHRK